MDFPPSSDVRTHESTYESAHSEARKKQFTGSLYIDTGDEEGVVVYLDGWPIYAELNGDKGVMGTDAVEEMLPLSGSIERHISNRDTVSMFRRYLRYIGRDDYLIDVYETDHVEIRSRTILVTKAGDLEEVPVPSGVRIGYSAADEYLIDWAEKNDFDGYGLSNNELIVFEEGGVSDRMRFKNDDLSILARMDSVDGVGALECEFLDIYTQDTSGGDADVEFDILGWEVVEDADVGEDGLIGRIFG